MTTKQQHVDQAAHNRAFWSGFDLDSTTFIDWVVTGIFYEGVHWVEAFLATVGEHPQDHRDRRLAMQRHAGRLGATPQDLEVLKTESENARYRCYKHAPSNVRQDLVPLADNIRNKIQRVII